MSAWSEGSYEDYQKARSALSLFARGLIRTEALEAFGPDTEVSYVCDENLRLMGVGGPQAVARTLEAVREMPDVHQDIECPDEDAPEEDFADWHLQEAQLTEATSTLTLQTWHLEQFIQNVQEPPAKAKRLLKALHRLRREYHNFYLDLLFESADSDWEEDE
jgi:hypothetical protein